MLERIFNGRTLTGLEKSMEATKMRNDAIAHNIANSDTPDYKRRYVEFEEYMLKAMQDGEQSDFELRRTREGHFPRGPQEDAGFSGVRATVMQDNSTTLRMDGNNVDIEHEMNEYNKNQVHYNMLVEQMNSEFRRLRTAMGRGA